MLKGLTRVITVTFYREETNITAFELAGHAESGPYGYDLVCAAVSAVSFGTVNAIDRLFHVNMDVKQGEDGGYLYVKIPQASNEETRDHVQTLLEGMLVSLETIERDYHQFIRITSK